MIMIRFKTSEADYFLVEFVFWMHVGVAFKWFSVLGKKSFNFMNRKATISKLEQPSLFSWICADFTEEWTREVFDDN